MLTPRLGCILQTFGEVHAIYVKFYAKYAEVYAASMKYLMTVVVQLMAFYVHNFYEFFLKT